MDSKNDLSINVVSYGVLIHEKGLYCLDIFLTDASAPYTYLNRSLNFRSHQSTIEEIATKWKAFEERKYSSAAFLDAVHDFDWDSIPTFTFYTQ